MRRKGEGEGEGREKVGGRVGERERQGKTLASFPGPIKKFWE